MRRRYQTRRKSGVDQLKVILQSDEIALLLALARWKLVFEIGEMFRDGERLRKNIHLKLDSNLSSASTRHRTHPCIVPGG